MLPDLEHVADRRVFSYRWQVKPQPQPPPLELLLPQGQ